MVLRQTQGTSNNLLTEPSYPERTSYKRYILNENPDLLTSASDGYVLRSMNECLSKWFIGQAVSPDWLFLTFASAIYQIFNLILFELLKTMCER